MYNSGLLDCLKGFCAIILHIVVQVCARVSHVWKRMWIDERVLSANGAWGVCIFIDLHPFLYLSMYIHTRIIYIYIWYKFILVYSPDPEY